MSHYEGGNRPLINYRELRGISAIPYAAAQSDTGGVVSGQTPRPGVQGAHLGDDKSQSNRRCNLHFFWQNWPGNANSPEVAPGAAKGVLDADKGGTEPAKRKGSAKGVLRPRQESTPPAQMSSSSAVAPPKGCEHTHSRDVPAAGTLPVESEPSCHNPVALGLCLHPPFLFLSFAACTLDPCALT